MGQLCKMIKLPPLLGMLITGILLGPYTTNILDQSILNISAEIRKIALVIILSRAGLGLDLSGLKKIDFKSDKQDICRHLSSMGKYIFLGRHIHWRVRTSSVKT